MSYTLCNSSFFGDNLRVTTNGVAVSHTAVLHVAKPIPPSLTPAPPTPAPSAQTGRAERPHNTPSQTQRTADGRHHHIAKRTMTFITSVSFVIFFNDDTQNISDICNYEKIT